MLKFNLYSDIGDFEHFNLFDFNNRVVYLRIGKICRYIQLPEFFGFPISQILGMWTLFATYEGMDETEQYYKFIAPTLLPKSYQVQLYFSKEDQQLKKINYANADFNIGSFILSYSSC